MSLRRIAVLIGILTLGRVLPMAAQAPDMIRGKISGPDGLPLEGVTVTATSMDDQTSRTAKTDKKGNYTIAFNPASGDYLMTANAIGFQPAPPTELRRNIDEFVLVYDAKLGKTAAVLSAVVTRGSRQQMDLNGDNDPTRNGGVGANDKNVNFADIAMSSMGNIAEMAASLPGVTLIPGTDGGAAGFSILGLGADQNITTLNGLSFDGSSLPADAVASARVSTNPYNPSQGGFSGAQVSLRLKSGSNIVMESVGSLQSPGSLIFTDPAGRALGAQQTNTGRYNISRSGPIQYDKTYYAASLQYTRTASLLKTLLNTDPLGLERLGISSDSVNNDLLGVLSRDGIPTTVSDLPNDKTIDAFTGSLNFDLNPTGTQNYTVGITGSGTRTLGASISNTSPALGTNGGTLNSYNTSAAVRTSWYIGAGFANDANFGAQYANSNSSPYVTLPDATVRLNSAFPDGTSAIKSFSVGGNPGLPTTSTNFTIQGNDAVSWYSINNQHQFQVTGATQFNKYTQDNTRNRLGTATYLSLADFGDTASTATCNSAGVPGACFANSYSRTLNPSVKQGSSVTSGFSVGDAYKPNTHFQMQYGFRGDVAKFLQEPTYNPAVDSIFPGNRNDHVPSAIYLSPRFGFSYTYGTGAQIAAFQGAARGVRGTIQGGFGMFQNVLRTNALDPATQGTGLPSGLQQISCVGSAVPAINWQQFLSDPNSIPGTCAGGASGLVFSNSAPAVSLFASNYVPARSYRGTVNWASTVLRDHFRATVGLTYSDNVHQAGTVDENFSDTARFTMADEGNRPVFAPLASIVNSSGTISSSASRLTSAFSTVNMMTSNLQSKSRQVQVSLSPAATKVNGFRWSALTYVWQNVRNLNQGFSSGGSTAGSPLDLDWGRANGDWRNQIRITLNYTLANKFTVGFTPVLQSGSPFTPMVDRDINGDGRVNDQAFIFDPAHTADTALSSAMSSLLSKASPAVRSCLLPQLGQIAERNSCQGPWLLTMGMNLRLVNQGLHIPQRMQVQVGLTNPLTGIDAAVHGWSHLHGWGAPTQIDNNLLSVQSFDPTTQSFKYVVNQRFGETRAGVTTRISPFQVNLQITYDVAPERERQNLNLNLRRGRTAGGTKWTEQQFRTTYTNQIRSPFQQLLQNADTLKLTDDQADSIAVLQKNFSRFQDSLWTPVAKYLAALPNDYDVDEAWSRVKQTWNLAVDHLLILGPAAKALLTKQQVDLLPAQLNLYLDETSIRALQPGNTAGRARAGGG